MIEKLGSSIRAGRLFTFGFALGDDGNTASEPATEPVRAKLSMGPGAGPAEEAAGRHVPPLTMRTGVPLWTCPAPGEVP